MASTPTRIASITDSMAKPTNEREKDIAFQQIVSALRGNWGTGEWNGGIESALGYWEKHSMFWNAHLSINANGSTEITFPFRVTDNVMVVYQDGQQPESIYIADATMATISRVGRIVVKLDMVKNVK